MDFARTWIRSLVQSFSLILNPLCTPHSLCTLQKEGSAKSQTHTLSLSLSLSFGQTNQHSLSLSLTLTHAPIHAHTLSLSLQHSHTPQLHPCFLFTFLVVSLIARSKFYSLSPLLPLSSFSLSLSSSIFLNILSFMLSLKEPACFLPRIACKARPNISTKGIFFTETTTALRV